MRTRSLIPSALLIALCMAVRAAAQTAATEPAPAAPAAPEITIKDDSAHAPAATKSKDSTGADTLSVDFPDEDIRNILRNVADLFELNLVVPDTLQGRTSIKLRDVTWRQIFHVVLSPVNFTYIEEGNIIKIVSNETLKDEPVTTEVFIINYAPATELSPALAPLVTAKGSIKVDARSNALIITETATQMNRIRPIIEKLDKATAQVMIESKFVEVTNADIKNIGVNWSSLSGMTLGASKINQTWSQDRGQQASATNQNDKKNTGGDTVTYVTGFDAPIPSTTSLPNGSVTLPSSTPSTTYLAGTGTDLTASTTYNGTTQNVFNNLSTIVNTGDTSRLASAVFSASDFNLIISALKTKNDTKLVSNPTVVTLNNSEAQINIGKEFPIPRYTYNTERGTYEVSGFEYRPIGIILKVTPQVNAQGFIKLTVEPEVSSSTENANFGTAEIPIVTTRKTKTQVSLKDGYTMGIGGLIENTVTKGETKVPVLGSIPVLGRLFRSNSTDDQLRNLIIFITAKTVPADGAPIEEVFDPRRIRQMGLRRDELPGYRDGSDPFAPPAEETEKKK